MSKASDTDNRKLVSPAWIVLHLVLTAIFFVFMQRVAYNHTPDWSETGKQIAAAYTSICLTGVFWICLSCFHVTLVDQVRRKKAGVRS